VANGTSWSNKGISCGLARKVTGSNKSGHGFTIGNGKYQKF
jgi:hypothetical protein